MTPKEIKEIEDEFRTDIEIVEDLEIQELNEKLISWEIKEENIKFKSGDLMCKVWDKYAEEIELEELKEYFENKIIYSSQEQKSKAYKGSYAYFYFNVAPIYIYALIEKGFANEAINALERRSEWSDLINIFLKDYFFIAKPYLNKIQVNKIYKILKSNNLYREINRSDTFLNVLTTIRSEMLDESLSKVNIEINRDKQELIARIQNWGFDEKYNKLLNSIDQYIDGSDEHINSGMVNNLRTFLSDFAVDIAENIATELKEEIPHIDGKQKIGDCRSYIKNKLELTDPEHGFMNRFIDVLHSEGGHSFSTDKEYFRLGRNITIEIALFLMKKFEKYKNNKKSNKFKLF